MQLNITTDYAIRMMLYMAKSRAYTSATKLSQFAVIGKEYTHKILRSLKKGGLVIATMGHRGGYALSRPADEITLLDVMKITEDSMYVNKCLQSEHVCSQSAVSTCDVRVAFLEFQKVLEKYFGNITLDDLAKDISIETTLTIKKHMEK